MNNKILQKFQSYLTERAGNLIRSQNWNANFDKLAQVINNNADITKENFDNIRGDNIPFSEEETEKTIADYIRTLNTSMNGLLSAPVFEEKNNKNITSITYNGSTGSFKITKADGSTFNIDTNIEKIPAKFEFVKNDMGNTFLKVTNDDGTSSVTDISTFVKEYSIVGSDTIFITETFEKGVIKSMPSIRKNSITLLELEPSLRLSITAYQSEIANALQSISTMVSEGTNLRNQMLTIENNIDASVELNKDYSNTTKEFANIAMSYAVGSGGVRPNEGIDNAKYYAEKAAESAASAAASAGGDFVPNSEFNTYKESISTELGKKALRTEIPTKTSQLTNDSFYMNASHMRSYPTVTEVNTKLNNYITKPVFNDVKERVNALETTKAGVTFLSSDGNTITFTGEGGDREVTTITDDKIITKKYSVQGTLIETATTTINGDTLVTEVVK